MGSDISELITEETEIDRKTIRELVQNSDIVEKTGLSSRFIDQCIDKKKAKREKYLEKLLKRETSKPSFEDKTANEAAEFTDESLICIGNTRFGQTQFRSRLISILQTT
jgi:hypothetical protein